jgi:peptide methionine sulfoxide reductase msrA/msrB
MNLNKTYVYLALIVIGIFVLVSYTNPFYDKPEENLEGMEIATFAGGCFWCMETPFEELSGVADVRSGYTGGEKENPTYKEVSAGITGHTEAVQVYYDPEQISYDELLEVFWRQIDPTDPDGQFVDRGSQYRSGIFYHDEIQKELAEVSKTNLDSSNRFDKPIVTEITEFDIFYEAEEYHQDYHAKNPTRYKFYRAGSGRDQFLDEFWGEDRYLNLNYENEIAKLTPLQYHITQEDGTEKPFDNEYWDNKEPGIYVDVVSGEPLFSSIDKYKSGTGWPSFTKPLVEENIVLKEDNRFFMKRTEIRSKNADSHIGHLFNDGPEPTGLRYCMNSAGMRFVHKDNLEQEGYGEFKGLFD